MAAPATLDHAALARFVASRGAHLRELKALMAEGPPLSAEEQEALHKAQQQSDQILALTASHLEAAQSQLDHVRRAERGTTVPDTRGTLLNQLG